MIEDMSKSARFDRVMAEHGLSATYLKSISYQKVKEAFIDKPEVVFAEFLDDEFKRGEELLGKLKKYRTTDVNLIKSPDTVDSVIAFNAVIKSVQDTFGEEKMTEAVMCKAIEAASYLGYRTIMGQAVSNGGYKK